MMGWAIIVARLCLALVFLYSGCEKLFHWRAAIEEVRGYGMPWPKTGAVLTILTQLVGSLLVASGYFVWLGAGLLAGFTAVATLLGHRFWQHSGEQFSRDFTTTLEHVAIVGGFLLLAALDLAPRF